MLSRASLRNTIVQALKDANTLAGQNVFSPRDWPTFSGNYPCILVQSYDEIKVSSGRQAPTFTTTATVSVIARAEEITAVLAEENAELLCEQIEIAVLTNYDLLRQLQHVASVKTIMQISAEGKKHTGEAQLDFALEFFEAFDPAPVHAVALENIQIHVDTINPYDATGTYSNPPFPASVTSAPRTSGPDGRDEGGLNIDLPQ